MGQIPELKDVKFVADKKLVDISYEKAKKVLPENRIFRGIIATGDIFVAKKEIKNKIKQNFNSLCCEMASMYDRTAFHFTTQLLFDEDEGWYRATEDGEHIPADVPDGLARIP